MLHGPVDPNLSNVAFAKARPLNACADLRVPGGAERTFEAQILSFKLRLFMFIADS